MACYSVGVVAVAGSVSCLVAGSIGCSVSWLIHNFVTIGCLGTCREWDMVGSLIPNCKLRYIKKILAEHKDGFFWNKNISALMRNFIKSFFYHFRFSLSCNLRDTALQVLYFSIIWEMQLLFCTCSWFLLDMRSDCFFASTVEKWQIPMKRA